MHFQIFRVDPVENHWQFILTHRLIELSLATLHFIDTTLQLLLLLACVLVSRCQRTFYVTLLVKRWRRSSSPLFR